MNPLQRETQRRECLGKTKHGTEHEARQLINRLLPGVQVYRCKHCGGYHIGARSIQGEEA